MRFDFEPSGLLVPRPHDHGYQCTADEVQRTFVVELGSPPWRVALFEGWDLVRRGVRELVPRARWWLWGCFVSDHATPVFGDAETINALAILPHEEVPRTPHRFEMLVSMLQGALDRHRVDAAFVVDFPADHPSHLETVDALEWKWRPQAAKGFADHTTKELVSAGFLEVLP